MKIKKQMNFIIMIFILQDRHATANAFPILDKKQNYEALYGAENATHTVLKFKRKLTTCDPDDYIITVWRFKY